VVKIRFVKIFDSKSSTASHVSPHVSGNLPPVANWSVFVKDWLEISNESDNGFDNLSVLFGQKERKKVELNLVLCIVGLYSKYSTYKL